MAAGLPRARSLSISLPREGRPAATEALERLRFELFRGQLAEISGGPQRSAVLTFAFRVVREAQAEGEPVAWILGRGSVFFPPDAAEAGVDLASLAVVRIPPAKRGVGADRMAALRAADVLIRSGGFGMVVLDLGRSPRLALASQARLAKLAERHRALIACLTESSVEEPSLGPLVSLRLEVARRSDDGSAWEARVLKDKRFGRQWRHEEVSRAPDGLR